MKMTYKTHQGKNEYTVELEGDTPKALFAKLSEFVETFQPGVCGNCTCPEIFPVTRTIDGNQFFSFQCSKCHYSLNYGQNKSGGKLFQKKKDANGQYTKTNGWTLFKNPRNDDDNEDDGDEEVQKPTQKSNGFKPRPK